MPRGEHWSPRQRADFVEDVTDLFEFGLDPESIARRLEMTTAALARRFHRWGERELARPFGAAAQRANRRARTQARRTRG